MKLEQKIQRFGAEQSIYCIKKQINVFEHKKIRPYVESAFLMSMRNAFHPESFYYLIVYISVQQI